MTRYIHNQLTRRNFIRKSVGTIGVAAIGNEIESASAQSTSGLRIIAIEEAFSVPGLTPPIPKAAIPLRDDVYNDWETRLNDVADIRLADMDANGVTMQVLSLCLGVEVIPDPVAATALAQQVNNFLAAAVAAHPNRFAGFAVLPLQDPEAAATELNRCVTQLGFKGVLHNSHVLGHYLDEPQFEPFWTELQSLNVPLYLHPALVPAEVIQEYNGQPVISGPTWGWTAATAAHVLRLIYGGVLDKYPSVSVILGHMGELLPAQMTRLDSRYFTAPPDQRPPNPPSYYLKKNVYITTSGFYDHAVLQAAISALGIDRVLFAIDYPFEFSADAVKFLTTAPLSPSELQHIAHSNTERILHI